jgi:hypothetical protein
MNISLYRVGLFVCFVITLFFDLVLSLSRVPIFTLILCGIVVIYEIVSPYIYTSR